MVTCSPVHACVWAQPCLVDEIMRAGFPEVMCYCSPKAFHHRMAAEVVLFFLFFFAALHLFLSLTVSK